MADAPESQLLPAPPSLSLRDAPGLIEATATVVSNLVMEAGLSTDCSETKTIFIHGGTGGTGTSAIQFPYVFGHRILV